MAWEATYLLSPTLLVLLAFGSWAQNPEILKLQEGETLSMICDYKAYPSIWPKAWARKTSANAFTILVTSDMAMDPRCSIRDFPRFHSFKVTMSGLTTWDSGEYWCGFYEHPYVYLLKTVYLEVAKAPTPPTTRHTQRTMMVTAPASATSPAVASPPGDWKWKAIVVAVVVAVLLLLSLSVLTILYLGRARGRGAREGEKTDSLHIYDDLRKENTDFNQPAASDQDAETIHYASLTHLNHSGTKDPIDSDSHMADRLLSVEYASITRQRPQLSMSPVLDGEPRN